jgi:Na+-transporting NADH:ubiquinone oxidoreductase subunit NqrE
MKNKISWWLGVFIPLFIVFAMTGILTLKQTETTFIEGLIITLPGFLAWGLALILICDEEYQ